MDRAEDRSDEDEVFQTAPSRNDDNLMPNSGIGRTRHLSDCIDSIGENISWKSYYKEHRHSFSNYSSQGAFGTNLNGSIERSQLGLVETRYFRYSDSCAASTNFKNNRSVTDENGFLAILRNCGNDAIDAGKTMHVGLPEEKNNENSNEVNAAVSQLKIGEEGERSDVRHAAMVVDKHSEEYNMTHARRGRAIILNNEKFSSTYLPHREGSEHDVVNLTSCLKLLNFQVEVHNNLTIAQITALIEGATKEDHSDADCFLLAVLTHGMDQNMLWAYDYPYNVDCLWMPFAANLCLTLAGKPKIFLIQACRGDQLDGGVRLVKKTEHTQIDSVTPSYKIPSLADFVIAFSTTAGMYSFRNAANGTWFIRSLCDELYKFGMEEDFLRIMTRVLRRVAVNYESQNEMVPLLDKKKQVPVILTTLIRDIYFRKK